MSKKKQADIESELAMAKETITVLKSVIDALKEEKQVLEYRVEAISDMGRIKCASDCLAAIISSTGNYEADDITMAMEAADDLVSAYDQIIEEKAVRWQKELADSAVAAKMDATEGTAN
jgi:FtsZ-binding cell division protein ZapB